MSSANPYDRSPYDTADVDDDEPGSTQRIAIPSFESDPTRLLDAAGTHRRDEPATRGYPGHADKLSVLGPTVCFKGELTADEDLMIQGQIEGSIHHHARHLTIGPKGKVKADIHANHIIIQGEVEGDLFGSEAVIIESSARVRGNIFAPSVALKEGAKFKGSIDMDDADERSSRTDASSDGRQGDSGKRRKTSTKETAPDSKVNELLE
jgi:cytoskeletal protein CcmA (bactofilin family)